MKLKSILLLLPVLMTSACGDNLDLLINSETAVDATTLTGAYMITADGDQTCDGNEAAILIAFGGTHAPGGVVPEGSVYFAAGSDCTSDSPEYAGTFAIADLPVSDFEYTIEFDDGTVVTFVADGTTISVGIEGSSVESLNTTFNLTAVTSDSDADAGADSDSDSELDIGDPIAIEDVAQGYYALDSEDYSAIIVISPNAETVSFALFEGSFMAEGASPGVLIGDVPFSDLSESDGVYTYVSEDGVSLQFSLTEDDAILTVSGAEVDGLNKTYTGFTFTAAGGGGGGGNTYQCEIPDAYQAMVLGSEASCEWYKNVHSRVWDTGCQPVPSFIDRNGRVVNFVRIRIYAATYGENQWNTYLNFQFDGDADDGDGCAYGDVGITMGGAFSLSDTGQSASFDEENQTMHNMVSTNMGDGDTLAASYYFTYISPTSASLYLNITDGAEDSGVDSRFNGEWSLTGTANSIENPYTGVGDR